LIDPIKTLTIADAVAEKILDMLSKGELKWGEKLDSQRDLAKILNVGVSSIREGLQILQAMGFVKVKHGAGTYITENHSFPLSKFINLSIYSETNIRDLMEAREVLDVGVAVLSSKKADSEDIKKMGIYLDKLEDSVRNKTPDYYAYDLEFHSALVKSTKNPFLEKFSYVLHASLENFIKAVEHTLEGVEMHREILNRIKERNPIGARDAMLMLLKHTRRIYLEYSYKKERKNSDEKSINRQAFT